MTNTHETILYINLNTLEANFNFLKSKLPNGAKTIAVVKAFAYGLGDIEISKHLEKLGIHAFWVADFEEGVQLRKQGITKPIIVANSGITLGMVTSAKRQRWYKRSNLSISCWEVSL